MTTIIKTGHTVRCIGECRQKKPATKEFFYRAPDTTNGLQGTCKLCLKARYKRKTANQPYDPNRFKPLWNGDDGIYC